MAEHFYSIHPDETLFMSYNATQQQQQQQQHQQMQQQLQQQQQQLHQLSSVVMGGQQPPSNNAANYLPGNAIEMDFTPGSNYFSTAAIDVNNNNCLRSSLRYFGNPPQNNNNNNYNKVPAFLPKYTPSYMQQMQQQQHHMLSAVATGTPSHHAPGLSLPQHTDANSSSICHYAHSNGNVSCFTRNRYTPYNHNRACAAAAAAAQNAASSSPLVGTTGITGFPFQQQQQLFAPIYQSGGGPPVIAAAAMTATVAATPELKYTSTVVAPIVSCSVTSTGALPKATSANSIATVSSSTSSAAAGNAIVVSTTTASQPYINTTPPINTDLSQTVTLQITNLDYSMDEASLRSFLLSQLKPITPVVSLVFEGSSYAKVTVPDLYFAKQVVSYLHRKKIGHKRMLVSYTRDSSLTEINTLRCQVAGLLKDVPYYTLPMYKFRELFQSRFKTSISVLDLYKMQDICSITSDNNEEKFISLQPEMVNSLESSPLMEGLHHSVPYCTIHFKREQHKGWAEQEIEPLPNVFMTITEIQQIIYPLLKSHPGDIPVASLVHCIEGELSIQITTDESGVNLEHLVCCVQGIQIQMNNFGIKIIGWLELDKEGGGSSSAQERGTYSKNSTVSDPLYQISREVVELVKMSPKSTMKFNRFIPAYHNHFGKQCRVADYGYTKLIELFEALSSVVQIMGDGENRQITLTHRTQIRRFTSDLLRILRAHGNKSVLLSELPLIFAQTQSRSFDVTDYGVCDIVDILDGLVNSNIVVVTTVQNGKDILISIPKRKQTNSEIEKTCIFAGEMVELFSNAPQYTILFQKFVRSYHYHFAFQCRLSDYGFLKLADLMDAIHGVVEMEFANEEDKKVSLSPKVARRVFAEQCKELIRSVHASSQTPMKLDEVLKLHKKKFGYQMQAQTLGVKELCEAVELMPFTEIYESDNCNWIVCHNDNKNFRIKCYRACKFLLAHETESKNNNSSNSDTNNDAHSPHPKPADSKSLMKLKDFLEKFNEKYKNEDKLTESTVKAMKPLIEIVIENDNQHVQISKCMKFLMKVIVLLEQRHTMILHEIKNVLDCTISTCFEFGYPNLFSLLEAFPDIFTVKIGITQERSEITLLRTTEMRISSLTSHQHLFGSIKLPSTKQKSMHHSSRTPLSDYNNRSSNLQGPPTKTRAICSDSSNNTTHHYQQQQLTKALIVTPQPQQQQAIQFCTAKIPTSYNSSNTTNNSSIYSTASQQSNIFNTSAFNTSGGSNKENTSNSSLNMFNISSNSSTNSSFNELNSSTGSNIITPAPPSISAYSAKLWDRRHNNQNYYQMQHHQHQLYDNAAVASIGVGLHPLIMPPPPLLSSQQLAIKESLSAAAPPQTIHDHQPPSTLYELVSNIQMCPMFEPPKPDTPPSDNMPFWIDPIWANNNSLAKANRNVTLNIKLPELKNHNVLPMLFSPYTLSKTENMKKQVFNFENHDRKIA